MSNKIYEQGRYPYPITLTAGQSVAVYTRDKCDVFLSAGYPNFPLSISKIGTVIGGQTVFGPYASGALITIDAGAAEVLYEVGLSPVVKEKYSNVTLSPTPATLNATGTLTAAMILNGILTSTTGAAVAATLDTGAIMDTSGTWAINEAVDWAVINTGGNTLTVTASTGHTIVGTATVLTVVSARFRTRKTAAGVFVTYRIA